MAQPLDYASVKQPPRTGRAGFIIIIAINAIALVASLGLLLVGVSQDGYASMISYLIGLPTIGAELCIGSVPAWMYMSNNGTILTPAARKTLLVASIVPPSIGVVGIILGCVLPATHGTC